MEEISVIGIDLAKSVFQLEALSPNGAMVWKKRPRRVAFMRLRRGRRRAVWSGSRRAAAPITGDAFSAARPDPACELLRSVPGLAPINAAGLSVALEAPQSCRNARVFGARHNCGA
jgi:hypothetical protein